LAVRQWRNLSLVLPFFLFFSVPSVDSAPSALILVLLIFNSDYQ
jgi:hypothetical protein